MAKGTKLLPPELNEATVEHFRARDRLTGEPVADPVLDALAAAMSAARQIAEQIAAARTTVLADETHTPQANAVRLRDLAQRLGERAAGKLDAARTRVLAELAAIAAATNAPPPPATAAGLALEAELRTALRTMSATDRGKAIASGDDTVAGALFRPGVPAWLSGMSEAEREPRRLAWRQSRHADAVAREARLGKALDALDRGGAALVGFVGGIGDDRAAAATAAAAKAAAAVTAPQQEASP